MRYADKMAELTDYARMRVTRCAYLTSQLRVTHAEDDYLRIALFLKNEYDQWEDAHAYVTVCTRVDSGKIRLRVQINGTFCDYYDEVTTKLSGFSELRLIAGALHQRINNEPFEP